MAGLAVDTRTAFLHGYLEEEKYVQPSVGFEYLRAGQSAATAACHIWLA